MDEQKKPVVGESVRTETDFDFVSLKSFSVAKERRKKYCPPHGIIFIVRPLSNLPGIPISPIVDETITPVV